MTQTVQAECPRCRSRLCETAAGTLVCPRCELAGALGEPGEQALPFSGVIGAYELESLIAHGGMGAVYRAYHRETGRTVALKTLLAGRLASDEMHERFVREARLAAKLRHPHIVPLLEVGEAEGLPYIAMEFVPGKNLADLARDGPLAPVQAAGILVKAAEAVAYAHEQGVAHRDLKPANILLDDAGEPRVADFGLARPLDSLVTELTAAGQMLGSPGYLAPERVPKGSGATEIEPSGVATDIYALGATLYYLLTGRAPFQGATLEAVLSQIVKAEPIAPRKLNPSVPVPLEAICLKCMEKEPRHRYASAADLASDSRRFLAGQPVQARLPAIAVRGWRWCRRNRALAATGAAVLLLFLVVLVGSPVALVRIGRERQRAERSAAAEAEQRLRAEDLAIQGRRRLYAARISLAQQIFEEGDVARTEEILESLQPKSGEEDLRGFEWHYLSRLCDAELLTLAGHQGRVRTVAFSPDGQTAASGGDDSLVRLWDTRSGKERLQLRGHISPVNGVVFAADGKTLASAGADGTARLWDSATGELLKVLCKETNALNSLALSPDGGMLAAGMGELAAGQDAPNQRYLPSTVQPSVDILIWDLRKQGISKALTTDARGIHTLAFSPDSTLLASGGASLEVFLCNLASGDPASVLTNGCQTAALGFSPDGRRLSVASWVPELADAQIKTLDPHSGREVAVKFEMPGPVTCLAYSPDGKCLATGGKDQLIRLWEAASGRLLRRFAGHTNVIWSLAWAPDSGKIASASWDGTVRLWDVKREEEDILPTLANFSLAISPDGRFIVTGGATIELWDAASGLHQRTLIEAQSNRLDFCVRFSADGSLLAACANDGVIHLLETKRWEQLGVLAGVKLDNERFFHVAAFAFSPDSATLAAALQDKTVRIYDVRTLREKMKIGGRDQYVPTLAYTPDGNMLVVGGHSIIFYDAATGRERGSIPQGAARVAVSPDGRKLAAAVENFSVALFDLATRKQEFRFKGHKDEIVGMAFSADSRTLATASWDGTVKLWHVVSGEPLLTFKSRYAMAWCVTFSPDNLTLAFCSGAQPASIGGELTLLHASARRPLR